MTTTPTLTATLLLVDDDDDLRESLSLALEVAGYVVHATDSGESALATLDDVDPDLVLMDGDLPGVSGAFAVCELRRRCPGLPVIGISCDERQKTMLDAGAVAFLPKPLEMPDLLEEINFQIRKRSRASQT